MNKRKKLVIRAIFIATLLCLSLTVNVSASNKKNKLKRYAISCNGNYFNSYNVLGSCDTLDEAVTKITENKYSAEWYVYDTQNGNTCVWPILSTKQEKVNRAVKWAVAISKDNKRHGYTCSGELGSTGLKNNCGRWGKYGDFSCSTIVVMAYELTGFADLRKVAAKKKLKMSNGVIGLNSTDMAASMLYSKKFKCITDKFKSKGTSYLKPGDVIGNSGHVALYIGKGKIVEAYINETFSPYGSSRPGDQLGYEIRIAPWNYTHWSYAYRPKIK